MTRRKRDSKRNDEFWMILKKNCRLYVPHRLKLLLQNCDSFQIMSRLPAQTSFADIVSFVQSRAHKNKTSVYGKFQEFCFNEDDVKIVRLIIDCAKDYETSRKKRRCRDNLSKSHSILTNEEWNNEFWRVLEKKYNLEVPGHLKHILFKQHCDSFPIIACLTQTNFNRIESYVRKKVYQRNIPKDGKFQDYYGKHTPGNCPELFRFCEDDLVTLKLIVEIAKDHLSTRKSISCDTEIHQ